MCKILKLPKSNQVCLNQITVAQISPKSNQILPKSFQIYPAPPTFVALGFRHIRATCQSENERINLISSTLRLLVHVLHDRYLVFLKCSLIYFYVFISTKQAAFEHLDDPSSAVNGSGLTPTYQPCLT